TLVVVTDHLLGDGGAALHLLARDGRPHRASGATDGHTGLGPKAAVLGGDHRLHHMLAALDHLLIADVVTVDTALGEHRLPIVVVAGRALVDRVGLGRVRHLHRRVQEGERTTAHDDEQAGDDEADPGDPPPQRFLGFFALGALASGALGATRTRGWGFGPALAARTTRLPGPGLGAGFVGRGARGSVRGGGHLVCGRVPGVRDLRGTVLPRRLAFILVVRIARVLGEALRGGPQGSFLGVVLVLLSLGALRGGKSLRRGRSRGRIGVHGLWWWTRDRLGPRRLRGRTRVLGLLIRGFLVRRFLVRRFLVRGVLGGLVRSHLGPTDGGRGSQNLRREGTVGGGVHRLGLTVDDITGVVDSLTDTIGL